MVVPFIYWSIPIGSIITFIIGIAIADPNVKDGSTFKPVIILGTILTSINVILIFFFDEIPIKVEK